MTRTTRLALTALLLASGCAAPRPPAPVAPPPPLEEQDGFAAGITPLTAEQAAQTEEAGTTEP